MRYDRKIKYLDYCENGERVRGSGFIKAEISEDFFKMELTVKGIRCAGEITGDVLLCGGGREEILGKIKLTGGQGEFRHICHMSPEGGGLIGSTGIGCDELSEIRIPLDEGREIVCFWDVPKKPAAPARNSGQETMADPAVKYPAVKYPAEEPVQKPAEQFAGLPAERPMKKETGSHITHRAEKAQERKETEAVPLLENKWLQLCAIYPHIKPFRDQREYLSIGPEDFVLFTSESYKAAGNSFMLHGYYNYRHLILTREERRGEVIYYVGVPGNYYDREKQVAVMFGFESFECAQEPAQSSDFGYYMMRVQL